MTTTFDINGIKINILKKAIKNLHLSVLPPNGEVRVSAPQNMNDDAIHVFILTKYAWIKAQRLKFQRQQRQSKREFVNGETVYLWGKQYRLEVVHSYECNDITIRNGRILLQTRPTSTIDQRENILNEFYRKQLKFAIYPLLVKWEKIIGVQTNSFGVKIMKTKWGTCNPVAKRIWFNLQLAKKPERYLEYIAVHELIHLIEESHNQKFIKLMNTCLPGWQMMRDELNALILDYIECSHQVVDV